MAKQGLASPLAILLRTLSTSFPYTLFLEPWVSKHVHVQVRPQRKVGPVFAVELHLQSHTMEL